MATKKTPRSPLPDNTVQEPYVAYESIPGNAPAAGDRHDDGIGTLLGLTSRTVKSIANRQDYIQLIRNGIPKKSLDRLSFHTGLTTAELSHMIHTSDRTLRRYTDDQLLNPEQTERLIELASLYTKGADVFGTEDAFKRWMDTPVTALGNKRPKELLDTSLGISILMDELGRIEYGVFA